MVLPGFFSFWIPTFAPLEFTGISILLYFDTLLVFRTFISTLANICSQVALIIAEIVDLLNDTRQVVSLETVGLIMRAAASYAIEDRYNAMKRRLTIQSALQNKNPLQQMKTYSVLALSDFKEELFGKKQISEGRGTFVEPRPLEGEVTIGCLFKIFLPPSGRSLFSSAYLLSFAINPKQPGHKFILNIALVVLFRVSTLIKNKQYISGTCRFWIPSSDTSRICGNLVVLKFEGEEGQGGASRIFTGKGKN